MRRVHIGIDIGASTGRLYAGWIEHGKLELEEIHRFVTEDSFLIDRRVRNIYRYYDEIVKGLKKYIHTHEAEIVSIGADGMGSDFGILDDQGNLIMQPISYRGVDLEDGIAKLVEEKYGRWNIYRSCGNQEMPSDTLHQLIRLVQKEDNAIKNGSCFLFIGDVIQYLLCGNASAEHSLAGYGRMFSQEKDDWIPEILDAFDIPRRLIPKVVRCGDHLGKLHSELCADIGLSYQPEIITPSTHDTACAAFAVPDKGDDFLFISSGSWSLLGMQTDAPVLTKEAWEMNASNSSMPLQRNMFKRIITGMWIMQCLQKCWGGIDFGEIVNQAERVTSNSFYMDPDAPEFYQPGNMAQAICAYIRAHYGEKKELELPCDGDVGVIARIFIESLAMKYRYYAKKLLRAARTKRNKIYIVGGGSANELLNQITANVLRMPVRTGIKEASAAGNILCQMYGAGELSSETEIKELLVNTFPVKTYFPQEVDFWEEKYQSFLRDTGLKE